MTSARDSLILRTIPFIRIFLLLLCNILIMEPRISEADYATWAGGTGSWHDRENWLDFTSCSSVENFFDFYKDLTSDELAALCAQHYTIPNASISVIMCPGGLAYIDEQADCGELIIYSGVVNQSAGTLTIHAVHGGEDLKIREGGIYSLNGGELNLTGNMGINQGSFQQHGGKVTVGGDDRDVLLFNVNTSYELSGGELRARRLKIHSSGTGNSIFTQTGGRVILLDVEIGCVGDNSSNAGTYKLSGGELIATEERIGDYSNQVLFEHSGGSNTVTGYLHIGLYSDSRALYELKGPAELIIATYNSNIGGYGPDHKSMRGVGELRVSNGGRITAAHSQAKLVATSSLGTIIGPGNYDIEVEYRSDQVYGYHPDRPHEYVAITFDRNQLTVGAKHEIHRIAPAEFCNGSVEGLLESSVFNIAFPGSFREGFKLTLPYLEDEVDDESHLVVMRQIDANSYELLPIIDKSTNYVVATSHEFGKFAIGRTDIEVVDPDPDLLNEGHIVDDVSELAENGRPVSGFTADGLASVLLRFHVAEDAEKVLFMISDENGDTSGVGSLFDPLNPEDEEVTTLEIEPQSVNDDRHMVFAALKPPLDFVRSHLQYRPGRRQEWLDANDPYRTIMITADVYSKLGEQNVLTTSLNHELTLIRPPVLLMHGFDPGHVLWNAAERCFDKWKVLSETGDSRLQVYAQEYPSNRDLDHCVSWLKDGMGEVLHKIRYNGVQDKTGSFAAAGVDIVGHSMGGILGRLYASKPSEPPQGLKRGGIHKLITIDSPHAGSPFANVMLDIIQTQTMMNIANVVRIIGDFFDTLTTWRRTDFGALEDLSVGSDVLVNIPVAHVRCHAIVGLGGSDFLRLGGTILNTLEPGPMKTSLLILRFLEKRIFSSGEHDLIVSRYSQEGGLRATEITHFYFESINEAAIHITVNRESRVETKVIDLLNTPISGSSAFADSFPSGASLMSNIDAEVITTLDLPESSGLSLLPEGILIANPVMGTEVHPSEHIFVTVEQNGSYLPERVLLISTVDALLDEAPPFVFDLETPITAADEIRLAAIAINAENQVAYSKELSIPIIIEETILSLSVSPSPVYLYDLIPERQIRVLAMFNDGIIRDITHVLSGTEYDTADHSTATVDQNGLVTAHTIGETTLHVRNGFVTVTCPIIVLSLPESIQLGDVNGDGEITAIDAALAAQCAAGLIELTPAEFQAADVDGDSQVTDDDAFLIAQYAAGLIDIFPIDNS